MVSFISFVLPISTRQAALRQDYYRISIFGFPFLPLPYKNKQLPCLADSYITHWFELLYKIPLILYCEHLQHFTKEISSSYFMSLPKSRPRLIKKIIAWQYLNNSLTVPGENSEWGVILFLSKVELTSLPSTGPKFPHNYLLLPFSYTHMISSRGTRQPTVKTARVVQSKAKNYKQNFKQI